ncbi:methyl-accepting chemotaxis protein [Pseudobdellovibrio sp. HCB154]|uniref:methyl-accepting chemotaxis protein n=1 Tax=Pseudobdellovibrio sp. HCB154 TaxID=3386277 RepID=UPI0039171241
MGEQWSKEAVAVQKQSKMFTISLCLVLVFSGIFLAWFLARKITLDLIDISTNLMNSSQSVKDQSELLRESSNNLSAASQEQAAAIAQTVAATSEITSMIARTSDNATQNTKLVENGLQLSHEGKEALRNLLDAFKVIKVSNADMTKQIKENTSALNEIVQLMNEIKSKTAAINDIVFQTKLLSFNASVEAARAGEAGKGFAVVAEEVSQLAVSSGNAAKEIEAILQRSDLRVTEIISQTLSSVEHLTQKGLEKTESGQQIANQSVSLFEQLSVTVENIAELTRQISEAAQEQSVGIREIDTAMQRVDASTAVSSKSAVECSHTADVATHEVNQTDLAVRRLQRIVYGNNSSRAS